MEEITLENAIKHIKEWGIESDNFISANFRQFMNRDEPDDNSCSLYDKHIKCLKMVVNAGIKANPLEPLVMQNDLNIKAFTIFEVVQYLAEQRSICGRQVNDLNLLHNIIFAPMPKEFTERCPNK